MMGAQFSHARALLTRGAGGVRCFSGSSGLAKEKHGSVFAPRAWFRGSNAETAVGTQDQEDIQTLAISQKGSEDLQLGSKMTCAHATSAGWKQREECNVYPFDQQRCKACVVLRSIYRILCGV